jgi:hypothetical protein
MSFRDYSAYPHANGRNIRQLVDKSSIVGLNQVVLFELHRLSLFSLSLDSRETSYRFTIISGYRKKYWRGLNGW